MTLGELIEDLKTSGVRQVGVLRKSSNDGGKGRVTIYFSPGKKIVYPFPANKIYPLVLKSDDLNQKVHSEKIKALKRSLIENWDEE